MSSWRIAAGALLGFCAVFVAIFVLTAARREGNNNYPSKIFDPRDERLEKLRHFVPYDPTPANWTNLITIGYVIGSLPAPSIAFEDPLATQQDNYISMVINQTNANGGIDVNGTMYKVRRVVYQDAGLSENTKILYERLIQVDQVDALIVGFVIGFNEQATIVAETLGVPSVNGEGNIDLQAIIPKLKWTASVVPNPATFAAPCMIPAAEAGVKTIVWSAIQSFNGLGIILNYTIKALDLNMTVLSYDQLDSTQMTTQAATCTYLDPLITKWLELGPDMWVGGSGDPQQSQWMIYCMRNRGFQPPLDYNYAVLVYQSYRNVTGWMTAGSIVDSAFASSYNYTSLIFNNTQDYVAQLESKFAAEGDSFSAVNVAAVETLLQAFTRAGSLNKTLVRNALFSSAGNPFQTVMGPLEINSNGYLVKSTQFCWQSGLTDPTLFTPVDAQGLVGSGPLKYPIDRAALEPQSWIDAHTPPTAWQSWGKWLTIGILVGAGVVGVAAFGLWLFFRLNTVVFFRNSDATGGDEWSNPE